MCSLLFDCSHAYLFSNCTEECNWDELQSTVMNLKYITVICLPTFTFSRKQSRLLFTLLFRSTGPVGELGAFPCARTVLYKPAVLRFPRRRCSM